MPAIGASANFDASLKTLYPFKKVLLHAYQTCPLFAMMNKREDFAGQTMEIFNWYGTPQGISSVFATAQTNNTAGAYKAFNLTRSRKYGIVKFEGETLDASATDAGAHLPAMKAGIDGIIRSLSTSLCTDLYGNGGGALGQIASIVTTLVTLTNPEDIVNFSEGMELQGSVTDGTSGAVHAGTVTVTGIDRDLGTLTTDSNWTAQIGALAADDFLFREGDFGVVISGLRSWIPDTAPTATLFFGVDRTADVTRLGGLRYLSATTGVGTYEEALQDAVSRMEREGAFGNGKISIFMNTKDRSILSRSLGSKARYEKIQIGVGGKNSTAKVGFNTLVLDDFNSPVEVFADPFCPVGRSFGLLMDSWIFSSLGPAPRILMKDGNRILREAAADDYEMRIGYYGNLGCHAPGWNSNILLPV